MKILKLSRLMITSSSCGVLALCLCAIAIALYPLRTMAGMLPAFPGAEGAGSHTVHGRGGTVLEVTNLNDSGSGSLRAAVEANYRRIVVFRVGGRINLKTPLVINRPNIMIAGQTAPGDGIVVVGRQIVIATNDVAIRYLRVRPDGYVKGKRNEIDGIEIWPNWPRNAYKGSEAYNIIIDHCSLSWASDENISTNGLVRDLTIQWNIISEPIYAEGGAFGRGFLISPLTKNISIHHNLFAHNDQRNPAVKAGSTVDFVNNVIYDWGHSASTLEPGWDDKTTLPSFVNFVGNYYKQGSACSRCRQEIWPFIEDGLSQKSKIYVRGNIGPRRQSNTLDEWAITGINDWANNARADWRATAPRVYQTLTPYGFPRINTSSAQEAYKQVIAKAGARLPNSDAVDRRIIQEVQNGTGKIISTNVDEVGGYPSYKSGTPPIDNDHDGMPNTWETQHGLNPNNAKDRNDDLDKDGYTNIEQYLNSIVRI